MSKNSKKDPVNGKGKTDKESWWADPDISYDEWLKQNEGKHKATKERLLAFEVWGEELGFDKNDPRDFHFDLICKKRIEYKKSYEANPLFIDLDSWPTGHDAEKALKAIDDPIRRDFYILYYMCILNRYSTYLHDIEITIPVPNIVYSFLLDFGREVTPIDQAVINKLLPHIWKGQREQAQDVLAGNFQLVGRLQYEKRVPDLIKALEPLLPGEFVSLPEIKEWLNSIFRIHRTTGNKPIGRTSLQDQLIAYNISFSKQ